MELLQPLQIEFDFEDNHYDFRTTIGRDSDWSNLMDMYAIKKEGLEPINRYEMDNSIQDNDDGTWSLVMNCNGYLFEITFDNPDEDTDETYMDFALKCIYVWSADNPDLPMIDVISMDYVDILQDKFAYIKEIK